MLPSALAPLLWRLEAPAKDRQPLVRFPRLARSMAANARAALVGLGLPACLLFEGCAVVENEQAITAQSALLGRSRPEIMACAGIPDETAAIRGVEMVLYSAAARYAAGGTVLGLQNCTVRITFTAGRVTAVDYLAGDPGPLAPLEACAKIVSACLR